MKSKNVIKRKIKCQKIEIISYNKIKIIPYCVTVCKRRKEYIK